ncbi:hypothetical protein F5Y15DRAFT_416678 [Xylariaceae sp. FL0016]|nr:hypothetical protein F5Y15DRAFT_416678 [Xylariaceae sp. FL0016]
MPREGTRSATGNSKPRVFQQVDTEPTIKRAVKPKAKKSPPVSEKAATKVKAAKPAGVTKKKSTPKESAGAKVKEIVKKTEHKVKKPAAKSKTATK